MKSAKPIPHLDGVLPDLSLQSLNHFRAPEPWGRWMLGLKSNLKLRAEGDGWVALRLEFELPAQNQSLLIRLNGTSAGSIPPQKEKKHLTLQLPLFLKRGLNELSFETNGSNRFPGRTPFAPGDPSDLSTAFFDLSFAPVSGLTSPAQPSFYGTLESPGPKAYWPAPFGQVTFFSTKRGPGELAYSLVTAKKAQVLSIRLDDKVVKVLQPTGPSPLLSGRVPLALDGRLHRVTITATSGVPRGATPNDSVAELERLYGAAPFYVQRLELTSPPPLSPHGALTLAAALTLLLLALIYRLLFRAGRLQAGTPP
ncbi:hypothetical protein [Deinococcus hopiensis]|uniref:Uncharacterized protein n=1 Tax=Deinococcus hopiensis KR-140 TaxID=695939 RepID=A0A1W1VA87_9DEIO|nr:hypothetical protein [Deinococcus hopiensis]SMB90196.1 hypothetical protein SAMN00790413_00678 [Deinococcus hopiensis KR-140]